MITIKINEQLIPLLEGGNVTASLLSRNVSVSAQKIDLSRFPIAKFRQYFREMFKDLNKLYQMKYSEPLWVDINKIDTDYYFNGSTSYIMDDNIDAEQIIKYKKTAGDVDIVIDKNKAKNLFNLLRDLEGKKVGEFRYFGSNRSNENLLADQINTVWMLRYNNYRVPCQVDFEMQTFVDDKPDQFTKFGHSSSFEDAKTLVTFKHLDNSEKQSYLKGGVLHKYLLGSIVGAISQRDDIVIATNNSTPDKITLSKSKAHQDPRMQAFSVDKGLRIKYEPMLDGNKEIKVNGKTVYKEVPTSKSDYDRDLKSIFEVLFGPFNDTDFKKMYSYIGLVDLIEKYHRSKKDKIADRFFEKLWGKDAQQLERDSASLDYDIKMAGWQYMRDKLKVKSNTEQKEIANYYKNYNSKDAQGFLEFIKNIKK